VSIEELFRNVRPRNGHTLVVCVISRTTNCNGAPYLGEQANRVKDAIVDNYNGPVDCHLTDLIQSAGLATRGAFVETEAMIRTGAVDLIAMEDLTRLGRGSEVAELFALAGEHHTRVLSLENGADT
jgi:hypothetical protein